MSDTPTETVQRSLKRCIRNPDFLSLFYETFLNASPEVREKFADTDMERQMRMVEASLYMCILAADDVPYANAAIKKLGGRHEALGIHAALYDLWLGSLMTAVETYDEAFDDEIAAAWHTVMRASIQRMLDQYTG